MVANFTVNVLRLHPLRQKELRTQQEVRSAARVHDSRIYLASAGVQVVAKTSLSYNPTTISACVLHSQ